MGVLGAESVHVASGYLDDADLADLTRAGAVGVMSRGGAMSGVAYALLRSRGVGVRYACATGNDCDVSVAELASVVAEDPELKLLLLYLEAIRDPGPFVETARIARARGLPIVALKSGRTPAGQQAAESHTGALANEDRVVEAFLERWEALFGEASAT